MNGIFLGVAMLAASTGVSPMPSAPRAAIVPAALTVDLGNAAATSPFPSHAAFNQQSRAVWTARPASLSRAQATNPKRSSRTGKIIGAAVGAFGGFLAGGAIGWAATSRPDDDVSGLRGVVIGAPIGAAVGAFIGYRLVK